MRSLQISYDMIYVEYYGCSDINVSILFEDKSEMRSTRKGG
jgi:hypothetical protein